MPCPQINRSVSGGVRSCARGKMQVEVGNKALYGRNKKCISSVHSSFKTISTTHLAQGPLKHTILSTDIVFTQQQQKKR